MPLTPHAQAVLTRMAESSAPLYHTLSVLRAREAYKRLAKLAGPPEPVANIANYAVPTVNGQVPLRIYTPLAAPPHALPVVLFFHGGGFVLGDVDMYDALCRTLANKSQAIVAAVNYHLAPEHPFPAAPEDCYATTAWVAAHAVDLGANDAQLAVMGDSAGAALAAVVALMTRDRSGPVLIQQVLVYPMLDPTLSSASMHEFADLGPLVHDDFVWFYHHYLPLDSDRAHPYASPLCAPKLSNLPAALIVTSEFDPLRDEGEAYAQELLAAGVMVSLKRYDGMIHGFFMMPTVLDEGKEAMEQAASALRRAFTV